MITIPGKVVNKSNNNEIRINSSLWREIKSVVENWHERNSKSRRWWIGPNDEARSFQEAVAWAVKAHFGAKKFGKESIALYINLVNQPIDCDGIKGVQDALQDAGIIDNDRQVVSLHVWHVKTDDGRPSMQLQIRPAAQQ